MNDLTGNRCPRCDAHALLRSWDELDEAEREVVRRLPGSADRPIDQRAARRRRWCTRCWHEATDDDAHKA